MNTQQILTALLPLIHSNKSVQDFYWNNPEAHQKAVLASQSLHKLIEQTDLTLPLTTEEEDLLLDYTHYLTHYNPPLTEEAVQQCGGR